MALQTTHTDHTLMPSVSDSTDHKAPVLTLAQPGAVVLVKPKSPAVSGILELIFPGLGLLYSTNVGAGLAVMVGTIVVTLGTWWERITLVASANTDAAAKTAQSHTAVCSSVIGKCTWYTTYFPDYTSVGVVTVIGAIVFLLWWVTRVHWAVASARKHNKLFPPEVVALSLTSVPVPPLFSGVIWLGRKLITGLVRLVHHLIRK